MLNTKMGSKILPSSSPFISIFLVSITNLFISLATSSSYYGAVTGGTWTTLQETVGISAMHMQLLPNNKVIMFDRTDFGPSNLSLPSSSPCRTNDDAVKLDCTAHSILYELTTNTYRPLTILTNTFCSSGALDSSGTLIQTGGDRSGDRIVRKFPPCRHCDWLELNSTILYNRRWYSTDQLLPDGRIIIVGGRRVFTYEFFPKRSATRLDNFTLPFLIGTRDPQEEANLYPFVHLLPDNTLFIFASNRSIVFDYTMNRVVRELPQMPGPDRRNYPLTGSSVLLPLKMPAPDEQMQGPEIMICGGAPSGAFLQATNFKRFVPASTTCGRIKVFDSNPVWVIETMPIPRVMGDMLLLPTGDVLLINGAGNGTAGWNNARDPVLSPVIYLPDEANPRRRFAVLSPTVTPRMYHSTAALMPDGSVLVAGSNPFPTYNFTGLPYRTEMSMEAFHPHYLDMRYGLLKPTVVSLEYTVSYNATFAVNFLLPLPWPAAEVNIVVALVAPAFTTHSLSMNQRVVLLWVAEVLRLSPVAYRLTAVGPVSANVAPPGFYMLFVVHGGIPSTSVWTQVG